jgi:uncharacterized membrane protein (DUF485 family)
VNEKLRGVFLPPADDDRFGTGLTFTDILFGFVLQELFVRLANWSALQAFVREQLIASAVLVLGSWIGYRRSRGRPRYQPKFFNFPLITLVLDQVMIIFYFRLAVLTPGTPGLVQADHLASATIKTLLIVFVLYAAWDLCGLAMSHARAGRYSNVTTDWRSPAITVVFLAAFAGLYLIPSYPHARNGQTSSPYTAEVVLVVATLVLVLYRFTKEIKNLWAPPTSSSQAGAVPTEPATG